MKQTFRKELLSGKTLIGTIVTQPNPAIAEILANVGFDWLWIDAEHSPMGMGEVQGILQAVEDRCACVVRVPTSNEVYIKKPIGIIGITVDAAKPFLDQGYSLIAVGIDTMIFGQAAQDILIQMKAEHAAKKR